MYKLAVLILMLSVFVPSHSAAQTNAELFEQYPALRSVADNTMEGTHFIVAIPPNEATNVNILHRALEIYVTSRHDTEVTIEMPGLGIGPFTKPVNALEITSFSSDAGELSWAMEVRQSELAGDNGLIIRSEHPISVWVLNAKRFSSEGFAARPTNLWGTEYVHLGYYDYPETQIVRGGGFIITAQEDETEVVLTLDGSSAGGTTTNGSKIGETIEFTLGHAQTYMLKGSGQDRAFDLTGTRITANKPVGVTSFHERTIIPTAMGQSSRDHISEMLPPVHAWGTEHITLEFFRENSGDYFRIVAQEPNTEFEVRYYEKDGDRRLIGIRQGMLVNAGDWAEFEEVNPSGGAESIRGTSVWTSSAPTLLMQYAYSSGWDNNQEFDPLMLVVPPTDQMAYGRSLTATPANADFNTNWVNVIARSPAEDVERNLLRSVELDGTPLFVRDPLFLVNQIPGTEYFWARVNVPPGAHLLTGSTQFSSFIYGFSRFESYAWTDGLRTNILNSGDVLGPEIQRDASDPVAYELVFQETRIDDTGIATIQLLPSLSSNVTLEVLDDLSLGGKDTTSRAILAFIDPSQAAEALVYARDRAGNLSVQQFTLDPVEIELSPDLLDFGLVRVGRSALRTVDLTNPNQFALTLTELTFPQAPEYELVSPALPVIIAPGATVTLSCSFSPTQAGDPDDIDANKAEGLLKFGENLSWPLTVRGRGVIPMLEISVPQFSVIEAGQSDCHTPGITISNLSEIAVSVTEVSELIAPFTLQTALPNFPMSLAPGSSLSLETVCFEPQVAGEVSQNFDVTLDGPQPNVFSAVLTARADVPSSVHAVNAFDVELTLSPNPSSGLVALSFVNPAEAMLYMRVVDLRGSTVHSQELGMFATGRHRQTLDLTKLASGSYFLEVYSNLFTAVQPLYRGR